MGLASVELPKARKQNFKIDSEEEVNKLEVRTRPQDPFLFPRTPSIIFCLCRLQATYYVFDKLEQWKLMVKFSKQLHMA